MTRKQEIKKEAIRNPLLGLGTFQEAFIRGAEWADQHPHWISVEDELPKENSGMVVVVNYMGRLDFMKYCKSGWHNNKRWCVPKGIITHWMPLPQPPSSSEIPNNCEKGGNQ